MTDQDLDRDHQENSNDGSTKDGKNDLSDPNHQLGLIQVYTGTGKGKTTAAIGLGLRAIGKGFKVYMIQFMKGDIEYGEISAVRGLDNFIIEQFGRPDFVSRDKPEKVDIDFARSALNRASEILAEQQYDILILDEINVALDWKLIELEPVLDLLKSKPKNIEIILTGRYAHQKIIDIADLVTNMQQVKHPYEQGILARDGIEH
jgi:cob(I)alamin adenosyltransferase